MDSLTGQQLPGKDETVVQADMVLADKKIIAFYFSAHWCPPCRLFTPVLAEFYSVSFMFLTRTILINSECSQDLVGAGESFEIVFVSSDKTPEDQMQYMRESHGDWLAVQHNTVLASQLKKKYEVSGIPTLIVVTRSGEIISRNGRSEVMEKGPQGFQKWIAAAKGM